MKLILPKYKLIKFRLPHIDRLVQCEGDIPRDHPPNLVRPGGRPDQAALHSPPTNPACFPCPSVLKSVHSAPMADLKMALSALKKVVRESVATLFAVQPPRNLDPVVLNAVVIHAKVVHESLKLLFFVQPFSLSFRETTTAVRMSSATTTPATRCAAGAVGRLRSLNTSSDGIGTI